MMKKGFTGTVLVLFIISCSSISKPVIYDTDLLVYSNDDLEVDYRIGSSVYFLKITNLTDGSISVDPDELVIVSPDGEARSLNAQSDSYWIPPSVICYLQMQSNDLFPHRYQ
ncbi:MAG: hypothetical protein JXR86_04290 [Spirochaetales bacterium]|nr:hypothetical protein [Spirochaetales bacterium]